ncbi:ABC transporter permease [Solwaraspora sp. WMMA2080]|uniref:ABC transporter permease n=1 Tax=unclassified Solwaraspora TaxID=2627926 RepID=UPI00248BF349|nr:MULTISPECIES: ABC transporter permease [unclassified Solwaraspora]WBB95105.1 ABC transporter permease [Solwaraspora sp. WMMA2059]WBC21011.1 ABC transporter permease [Solwaraspora sp. WMMA2080]
MRQPTSGTTVTLEPDSGPTLAELARQHGLAVSGARPSLGAYVKQLWSRRHFIWAYSNARLIAMYTNARLGQIWQVITPLANAGVYFLVFGLLLGTDRGIDNYIAYLCTGIFIFTFTQQAVTTSARSIGDNMNLIRAVHFPRASLPLTSVLVQVQQLAPSMAVLAVIMLATGEWIDLSWLLLIPALLLQTLFSGGLAMMVARWAARTSDLSQLLPFVMRTWLYSSGVFYSIDRFTGDLPGWVVTVLQFNPMAVYIDLVRYALMDSMGSPPGYLWPAAGGWAVLVGVVGFIYFWRAEEEYGRG